MLAINRAVTAADVASKYIEATRRLIILDHDGVLVPVTPRPRLTVPTQEMKNVVKKLGDDGRNIVVLISNRKRDDLEPHWPEANIVLVAENGALYREAGNKWQTIFEVNTGWIDKLTPALDALSFQFDGTFIERRSMSICWHYAAAKLKLGQADVRQILAAIRSLAHDDEFTIHVDECMVELSTPGIDAGSFVAKWIGNKSFDFILALGEAKTDDTLFGLFTRNAFTIRVNPQLLTRASYILTDQRDVLGLLEEVARLS